MIVQTYKCDHVGCQEVKRATNHWVVVRKMDDRLEIRKWANDPSLLDDPRSSHFCGVGHAHKFISEQMGEL